MKTINALIAITLITLLTACGGGGSGGSNKVPNVGGGDNGGDGGSNVKASIGFSEAIPPQIINMGRNASNSDNSNYYAADTISIQWSMGIKNLRESGRNLVSDPIFYNAKVFLSVDDVIDGSDVVLIDTDCRLPEDSNNYCGAWGPFQCVYAPDNTNTMVCSSREDMGAQSRYTNTVDTTTFLDTISKSAKLLFKSCMNEDASKCTEYALDLTLN